MTKPYTRFVLLCLVGLTMNNPAKAQKDSAKPTATVREQAANEQLPSYEAAVEKVVRTTYAKLTRFSRAALLVDSRIESNLASEDRYLRFQLSNFKVGPIQEILDAAHGEIKTRGTGEILQVGRMVTLHNDADPHIAYRAEWITGQYAAGYDPKWTIGDLLRHDAAMYHDVGGYALYDVTVWFKGKTRSYRSMALFHNPYGSMENFNPTFWDSVVSSGGILKDVWGEKRPAVGEKSESGSGQEPISVVPPLYSSGKTVGAKWLEHQKDAADGAVRVAATASSSYSERPMVGDITNTTEDYREHLTGRHGQSITFRPSCTTLTNTEQLCRVDFGFIYIYETGKTSNRLYSHRNRVDYVLGTHTGPRGTPISCYSGHGIATKNCVDPDCMFTATLVGSGLSMQMTGGDVWRSQLVHGNTCNIASWGGGCLDSPTPLAKTSGKEPAPNLIDPYCCSADEQFDCLKGGGEWNNSSCTCLSPIVIDVAGNGFNFTGAESGVLFDPARTGTPEQVSWTAADSDDAWLVLDRNGNGLIDDGKELFGSSTPQPYLARGESKNGFRALAVFDEGRNGGNNNGQIDSGDSVFSSLKLWQDRNHNGVSEGGELQSLANSEIRVIELDYKESRQKDEHGNWFRYRAKVRDANGAQVGRWAWDVFLQRPH